VRFAFYQADHPWEPWSYIGQKSGGEFIGDKKTKRQPLVWAIAQPKVYPQQS
jgi:hypothetical protein